VGRGVGFADPTALLADHDGEFGFPVDRVGFLRQGQIIVRADQGLGVLGISFYVSPFWGLLWSSASLSWSEEWLTVLLLHGGVGAVLHDFRLNWWHWVRFRTPFAYRNPGWSLAALLGCRCRQFSTLF
jgi:hypothetical protein